MDFSPINTPNGRLLYLESTGLIADWNKLQQDIFDFVGKSPKITFATGLTYFYFFESPLHESFKQSVSWLAREIVGQPNLPKDSELKTYDLDQGNAFRFRLGEASAFLPEGLKAAFTQALSTLQKENIKIASTWRLSMLDEVLDGVLTLTLFLDFFPEDLSQNNDLV